MKTTLTGIAKGIATGLILATLGGCADGNAGQKFLFGDSIGKAAGRDVGEIYKGFALFKDRESYRDPNSTTNSTYKPNFDPLGLDEAMSKGITAAARAILSPEQRKKLEEEDNAEKEKRHPKSSSYSHSTGYWRQIDGKWVYVGE
jgi:hypothetical protein